MKEGIQQQHFDIIIIGSGVLGTFHAYHALKRNKKVLLLEKDNYPVGATVRNFGQIVPSGMAGKWFDYGVRSTEIYQSIQQEFDISIRHNGSIYIASDEEEQILIHEMKTYYDSKGYEARLLSKSKVSRKYTALKPSYVKEAIYYPQEISLEPSQMIYRLHEYLSQKFSLFTLRYRATATDCVSSSNEVIVKTAGGEKFYGGKVIICNGYESRLLFPEFFGNSGQVISKLQMTRTIPMPDVPLEGNVLTGLSIRRYECFEAYCPSFKKLTMPERYKELNQWGIHILFKKAADGSIIIGDSHEYADTDHFDDLGFKMNEQINALILKEAQRIVNFDVNKIQETWIGFYPQHPEKNILEFDIDKNIHIRTCIGGKGMTAGPGYAEDSMNKILS